MKERYLERLKELLLEYNINDDEISDILDDYGEMIDDALSKKISEEKIIKMIGSPEQVMKNLSEEFVDGEEYIYIHRGGHSKATNRDNKITTITPFISLVIFMVLGLGFNLWHPGWLIFLSIPMVAIVVNLFDKDSMNGWIALSPFIALIIFLVLGFWLNLWHPAWLIFIIVPIIAIFSSVKTMRFISFLTAISPFVAIVIFVLVWYYAKIWNPIWLIFMIIPMIGVLHESKIWKVVIFELGFLISIGVYLYIGYTYNEWGYGLFAFLIPVGISLIFSEDSFFVINKNNRFEWLLTIALIIIYISLGIIFNNTWAYLWMIFLLVPMFAIIRHTPKEHHLVACMPFVTTIIFFSLGYFLDWWAFSWLAFILIPVVAIIKNA